MLADLVSQSILGHTQLDEILERISYSTDPATAAAEADLLSECTPESIELKRTVFRQHRRRQVLRDGAPPPSGLTGVHSPHRDSGQIVKQGRDTDTEPQRQRYECRDCGRRFDDLTDTIFAGHHQSLRVWVLVFYFMGLNLPNEQIARELDLDPDDAQRMTTLLRDGSFSASPR